MLFTCIKCGHKWAGRRRQEYFAHTRIYGYPNRCPSCNTRNWRDLTDPKWTWILPEVKP